MSFAEPQFAYSARYGKQNMIIIPSTSDDTRAYPFTRFRGDYKIKDGCVTSVYGCYQCRKTNDRSSSGIPVVKVDQLKKAFKSDPNVFHICGGGVPLNQLRGTELKRAVQAEVMKSGVTPKVAVSKLNETLNQKYGQEDEQTLKEIEASIGNSNALKKGMQRAKRARVQAVRSKNASRDQSEEPMDQLIQLKEKSEGLKKGVQHPKAAKLPAKYEISEQPDVPMEQYIQLNDQSSDQAVLPKTENKDPTPEPLTVSEPAPSISPVPSTSALIDIETSFPKPQYAYGARYGKQEMIIIPSTSDETRSYPFTRFRGDYKTADGSVTSFYGCYQCRKTNDRSSSGIPVVKVDKIKKAFKSDPNVHHICGDGLPLNQLRGTELKRAVQAEILESGVAPKAAVSKLKESLNRKYGNEDEQTLKEIEDSIGNSNALKKGMQRAKRAKLARSKNETTDQPDEPVEQDVSLNNLSELPEVENEDLTPEQQAFYDLVSQFLGPLDT